mmetsp:Transcript_68455/g.178244  ORF Transcript_68455/g.178244 Transcript_68455/m.178244 type:complete len:247 (-) Transcript_68455:309-1049(-)
MRRFALGPYSCCQSETWVSASRCRTSLPEKPCSGIGACASMPLILPRAAGGAVASEGDASAAPPAAARSAASSGDPPPAAEAPAGAEAPAPSRECWAAAADRASEWTPRRSKWTAACPAPMKNSPHRCCSSSWVSMLLRGSQRSLMKPRHSPKSADSRGRPAHRSARIIFILTLRASECSASRLPDIPLLVTRCWPGGMRLGGSSAVPFARARPLRRWFSIRAACCCGAAPARRRCPGLWWCLRPW